MNALKVKNKRIVYQDPKRGVKTKFKKYIETTLLSFDHGPMKHFIDWFQYLKTKGYGSTAPIFPRTKVIQNVEGNLSFQTNGEVEREFWSSAGPIRTMFRKRSAAAGLRYFPPHSFRHLHVVLATKKCRTMEEFKTISQNLGHESIMTTIPVYGNYTETELSEIIQGIDFSNNQSEGNLAIPEEVIQDLARSLRKINFKNNT